MSMHSPHLAQALMRQDFVSFIAKGIKTLSPSHTFVGAWYIEHLAYELLKCLTGECPRLLVSMPPRFGKSTIISVLFVAWCMGRDPTLRVICASYSAELAERLSLDFRKIVESDWYRNLFPKFKINPAKCNAREVQTTSGGYRFATSVGGPLTGIGGDMLIFDDLMKADDAFSEVGRQAVVDWLENTAFSRLDDQDSGSIILVGQRLHPLDPIGNLLAKGGWDHLCLPAIAEKPGVYRLLRINGYVEHHVKTGDLLDPVRWPQAALDKAKSDMGVAKFNAQYLQRPEYESECYIDWNWFPRFESPPEFDFLIISVDPAIATKSTSDWSVAMVIGVRGIHHYIVHVERKRLGFESLATRLDQLAEKYHADVIVIEESGIGISLIEHLRGQARHLTLGAPVKGDKKTRAMKVLPFIEKGRVLLPEQALFLDAMRQEFQAFPNGIHDDQVDSLTQFLIWRIEILRRAARERRHRHRELQYTYPFL